MRIIAVIVVFLVCACSDEPREQLPSRDFSFAGLKLGMLQRDVFESGVSGYRPSKIGSRQVDCFDKDEWKLCFEYGETVESHSNDMDGILSEELSRQVVTITGTREAKPDDLQKPEGVYATLKQGLVEKYGPSQEDLSTTGRYAYRRRSGSLKYRDSWFDPETERKLSILLRDDGSVRVWLEDETRERKKEEERLRQLAKEDRRLKSVLE